MMYEDAQRYIDELMTRFNASFSAADKSLIESLYREVLGKAFRATTCQRCYHDAVMEMALYLRKEKQMKPKTRYTMRAGFIIACPAFHDGKIYSNANLTDEVAEEYLAMFPNQKQYFDENPAFVASDAKKDVKGVVTKDGKKSPVKTKKTKK